MKKISHVFCKILALSLVFTFSSKMDLTKNVNAMEANIKPTINVDLSKPASSVYEAMLKIAMCVLTRKGYDVVEPFNHIPYAKDTSWEFACIRLGSNKQEIIYESDTYELRNFLNKTDDSTKRQWREYVYILANETKLSLEFILLYLMSAKPYQFPDVIRTLMTQFGKYSECPLKGDDRKKEIDEIKSIAMKFFIS